MNPFHEALEAERESLNMQFQIARQQFPRLEGAIFLKYLRELVEPVYLATVKHNTQETLLHDLYHAALTLTGRGLFERSELLRRAWTDVLANVGHLVAQEPKPTIAAVTNIVCKLESELSQNAHLWVNRMSKAGKPIPDVATFKQAGIIMAWQCGYSFAREEALTYCEQLDPALTCYLLGLPPQNAEDTQQMLKQFRADIWYNALDNLPQKKPISLVRKVGGFRGFGGIFLQPPIITIQENRFVAEANHEQYELVVDAFGAMFRHYEGTKIEELQTLNPHFYIDEKGNITQRDRITRIEKLANWSSVASTESMLAVTLPDSHYIFLFA